MKANYINLTVLVSLVCRLWSIWKVNLFWTAVWSWSGEVELFSFWPLLIDSQQLSSLLIATDIVSVWTFPADISPFHLQGVACPQRKRNIEQIMGWRGFHLATFYLFEWVKINE
jgi:hypothetical protein